MGLATARRVPAAQIQLELTLSGDVLSAILVGARSSPGPLRTAACWKLDRAKVAAVVEEMTSSLARAGGFWELAADGRQQMAQQGQRLYELALPPSVRAALRQRPPQELVLVLDDALAWVPWEWMHTGEWFVGEACAVGRVIRTERTVAGPARPEARARPRMLVVADPRGDLLGCYYEGVTLRDRFDASEAPVAVDMRTTGVRAEELKRLLRAYDLVHYAGHAETHPADPSSSGWLLSDGVLTAAEILELAGGAPFPRLVFVNACRSGRVDQELGAPGAALYSLASAFLLAGVQHYVGTLWDVPDEPASHFALSFYAALFRGDTVGEAACAGRSALSERYGPESVLWAAWVVYGDPGARLVAPRPSAETRRPGSRPTGPPAITPVHGPRSGQSQAMRGGRRAPRLRLGAGADPPFERAGAGSRRVLAALALGTAMALSAVLTVLAVRAPARAGASLTPLAVVAGVHDTLTFSAPHARLRELAREPERGAESPRGGLDVDLQPARPGAAEVAVWHVSPDAPPRRLSLEPERGDPSERAQAVSGEGALIIAAGRLPAIEAGEAPARDGATADPLLAHEARELAARLRQHYARVVVIGLHDR